MVAKNQNQIFHVSHWVDRVGGWIHNHPHFWVQMGQLESYFLREEMNALRIEKPIYVSGLARSGSTLLLEILSRHRGLVSHQYKDYPPIYTPFWWNWLLRWMVTQKVKPTERAHRDGILITPDSPEAMEEILWMSFFPTLHEVTTSNVLDETTSHSKFEKFYLDHIRKLLLVRKGNRYLAKGNYNLTRLEYILKLFPDARFIIPIRHPVGHIASLMKQHTLFCQGTQETPPALKHLQRIGHFEFGLDWRPINTDNTLIIKEIIELWQTKQAIQAWSRYWNQLYSYIAKRLEANQPLRQATLVIRFEELCQSPKKTIQALLEHCDLEQDKEIANEFAAKIKYPSYYTPLFSEIEINTITQETFQTAQYFGY